LKETGLYAETLEKLKNGGAGRQPAHGMEEDLYANNSDSQCYKKNMVPLVVSANVWPPTGKQTPEAAQFFWRFRLRPVFNEGTNRRPGYPFCLSNVESDYYTHCVVKPMDTTEAILSHAFLHGNGTYDWIPKETDGPALASGASRPALASGASGKPFLRLVLNWSSFAKPLDIEVLPTVPFQIKQTPTHYTITQLGKETCLERVERGGAKGDVLYPLILSFANVSWTVRLSDSMEPC